MLFSANAVQYNCHLTSSFIFNLFFMKNKMCVVHKVAAVLCLVGGLNWGLVGAFEFNLVEYLLGNWAAVERTVYVLVGLSAVAMLFSCHCKKCGGGGACACGGDKGGNKDKSCCA